MSDRPSHNLAGLGIDLARQIDAICRRFEAEWRAGREPRLQDYLNDVPGDIVRALRNELETLLHEVRTPSGMEPSPGDGVGKPPSTIAEAPTVAPGTPMAVPVSDPARTSVHEAATLGR